EDFIHGGNNRQPNGCMSRWCFWRMRMAVLALHLSQHRLVPGGSMISRVQLAACLVLFASSTCVHAQKQQVIGAPPETSNMKLVGYSDLQARSAYQPTIHHQGDRWIAYIGHHGGTDAVPSPVNPMTGQAEPNGTSIVDVTDPAHPKYLRHLPGQEGK